MVPVSRSESGLESQQGDRMRTKLSIGIALALLLAPATLLGQEKEQQCQLQGAPELSLAQTFLQQAQDTTMSESQRQAAAEKAWSEALQGPIEDDTDNATFYYFGALAQVQLENYARTDSLLNVFLEKAGEGCAKRAEQIRFQAWASLYNQAIQAYNGGNQDRALKKFEQANSIYDDARSLVNAATLHEEQGNRSRAMELYSRALETGGEPQQMRTALTKLADSRLRQGDTAAAMEQYEQYLSNNPEDVSVQATYAQTLAQAGQSDSAQAIFSGLLDRSGLTFEQWSQIGVGLFQASSYEQAIEAFRSAREMRPLNKETMENLLSAYSQAEQWEQIPALADTVIDWYPYDSKNYRPAVRAYDNMKQPKQAQQLLTELQNLPIQITRLGMTEQGLVQGQFQTTSESAAGQQITIPFEFLDSRGNVVTTHEFTTTLPAQGEAGTIEFRVQTEGDLASFRYSKDSGFGGSSSGSGSSGGR